MFDYEKTSANIDELEEENFDIQNSPSRGNRSEIITEVPI